MYSKTWEEFRLRDPPVVPPKSHGITVYGVIIYTLVLGLVITAEVLYCRKQNDMTKISSEVFHE